MANKTYQIKIESIFGGMSPSSYFGNENQYINSIGIDPDLDINANFGWTTILDDTLAQKPSGLIVPVRAGIISGTFTGAPHWFVRVPKILSTTKEMYVYDSVGSVYTFSPGTMSITGLGDLNDGASASGNGAEYYDNYVYFARDTTIARYGPLDGTPTFTDDYWVNTLGLAALSNTTYPRGQYGPTATPNHLLKRHSDGRLYIADIVDNQGVLHFISTTKTTVEGDTNNGSTFNAIDFPYNYWPTAIESYGSQLVIALYEGNNVGGTATFKGTRAKIVFWDTTSSSYSQIIDYQFPDPFIAKIVNRNGDLYFFSGNESQGFPMRITRYIGGYSFEQIAYYPNTYLPAPGAYFDDMTRIYFAGNFIPSADENDTESSYGRPDVKALGSVFGGNGIYSIMGVGGTTAAVVTAIIKDESAVYAGFYSVAGTDYGGMVGRMSTEDRLPQRNIWRSNMFRIGQPFKIKKINIPFATTLSNVSGVSTTKEITPVVWVDSGSFKHTLTTINSTNFPQAITTQSATIYPNGLTGGSHFFLELYFENDEPMVVSLPITIEYELIDN